jgi:hypothetical protein
MQVQEEQVVVWVNRTAHYDGRMFVAITECGSSVKLWEETIMAVPIRNAVFWEGTDRPAVVQDFQDKHFTHEECLNVNFKIEYTSHHREGVDDYAWYECHLVQPSLIQRPPEGYCLAVVCIQHQGITVQQFIP